MMTLVLDTRGTLISRYTEQVCLLPGAVGAARGLARRPSQASLLHRQSGTGRKRRHTSGTLNSGDPDVGDYDGSRDGLLHRGFNVV